VAAERRAPALREHEKLGHAELELCAPPAATDPLYQRWHPTRHPFSRSYPVMGI